MTDLDAAKRDYASNSKYYLTLAAAARELEISAQTLRKWANLGYITLKEFGPDECKIRRVPRDEIERLKKIA